MRGNFVNLVLFMGLCTSGGCKSLAEFCCENPMQNFFFHCLILIVYLPLKGVGDLDDFGSIVGGKVSHKDVDKLGRNLEKVKISTW